MTRETKIEGKYQLTIGEIIQKVKSMGHLNRSGEPKYVQFDFGTAIPTCVDSWRGSYDLPALGYELTGYDNEDRHLAQKTVSGFVKELELAISGRVYDGWKGGEYTFNKNQGLWVSNSGNGSYTAIIDVIDEGYCITLLTSMCEF